MAITSITLVLMFIAAQSESPSFEITTKKKEDRVTVAVADQKATIDIHSKSGIGSAAITPKAGEWPKTVIVRFHLGGLERFAVSNGKTTLSGSVGSYGENAKRLHLSQGDEGKEVEKNSPYWTDIKIMGTDGKPSTDSPLKDGYFEIVVPKAMLGDQAKSLTISWIDFYRR